jgi:hypothetical protein
MGLLAAVGCFAIAGYAGGTAGWVQKSNQAAKPLLEYITKYTPENGSSIGIDQADESVVDLKPNLYARSKEDGERIVQQLQVKEASESDPNVRRDLDILITAQKNSLETAKLNHELMLPFYDVGEMVFQGLQTLLDPRNSADRQARAIVRLNRYVGQETGFEPITELAKARTEEMLGNAKLIRPYVAEVNDAINNTRTYLDGIAELFRTAKLTGWEQPHAALTRQLLDYKDWLQKQILPQARPTNPLPEAIYAEGESWTLTAHEARPGHDLQFTSMVDNGVSMARSIFADNSANVEGWAVYMEAVMEPYEPLDGQLFSLDDRLLRIARAFLDPMLNLGVTKPEEAKAFLVNEVALSESDAKEEVERYTYRAPGQAAAYFYGYMTLRELRERTKLTLGAKFDEKAYHDFILSQGLLPLNLMAEAIQKEFVPRYSSEPLSGSSHSSGNSVGH